MHVVTHIACITDDILLSVLRIRDGRTIRFLSGGGCFFFSGYAFYKNTKVDAKKQKTKQTIADILQMMMSGEYGLLRAWTVSWVYPGVYQSPCNGSNTLSVYSLYVKL